MTTAITDLAGFPMVMTVSQKAINDQLAMLYGQSTNQADRFPNVPWALSEKDGAWSLTVEQFAAPEVDFDTETKMGCRLKMTILKGNFTTWAYKGMVNGKPNMEQVDTPLDSLTMYLTTPMKQIVDDSFEDEDFEVQALFADLENMQRIELNLSENPQFASLGTVQLGLEEILAKRICEIGHDDPHALLFAGVKIPQIPEDERTTGTLKPSALTFSTTVIKHGNTYVSGNLNYLLWLDDAKLIPTGDAYGAFNDSLLRPEKSKATFVLSEAVVLEKILKPMLKGSFGETIDLGLDRGAYGSAPAKLYLNSEFGFGVELNGRGRSATLMSIDSTIENSKIKVQYRIKSSVYGAFEDYRIDITAYRLVSIYLEDEKLKIKVSAPTQVAYWEDDNNPFHDFTELADFGLNPDEAFCAKILESLNLPGNHTWRFELVTLDGPLYLTAAYE